MKKHSSQALIGALVLPQEISLKTTGEITLKVFRQLLLLVHSVKQCQMR